jgi:hypothetical protein
VSKDLELVEIPLSGIIVMLVTIVVKFFVRLHAWFTPGYVPLWLFMIGLFYAFPVGVVRKSEFKELHCPR